MYTMPQSVRVLDLLGPALEEQIGNANDVIYAKCAATSELSALGAALLNLWIVMVKAGGATTLEQERGAADVLALLMDADNMSMLNDYVTVLSVVKRQKIAESHAHHTGDHMKVARNLFTKLRHVLRVPHEKQRRACNTIPFDARWWGSRLQVATAACLVQILGLQLHHPHMACALVPFPPAPSQLQYSNEAFLQDVSSQVRAWCKRYGRGVAESIAQRVAVRIASKAI